MLILAACYARLRALVPRARMALVASAGATILVAVSLIAASRIGQPAATHVDAVEERQEPAPLDPVVRLSPAQAAKAQLQTTSVEVRMLQDERRVPGRIGYNESRRLEVRMPVDGLVSQVLVTPGDVVKKGDRLAILSSVAVGLARDEIVKAEADCAIARRERDWAAEIAANLESLHAALQSHPPVEEIEREYQDRPLGNHRDKIVSAYSRYLFAEGTYRSSESLTGALPGNTIRERRSDKEVARASFLGICEQSRFEAAQRRDLAQANLEHAERLVAVNRQKLRLHLGPFAELSSAPADATLCEVVLQSSIDGFVEQRLVTDGAQFSAAQNLFVLANMDTVWVSAQIYAREWADFDLRSVKKVLVDCPAAPDKRLQAAPLFVSVGASPQSHAVPVVAELDNAAGRFKPGMFAWVTIPFGAPRRALVVPEGAVMRHESQAFVFVAAGEGAYRKADVSLGMSTEHWIEVLSGVQEGDPVVSEGAFYLKSEWLLRGQDD